jgi:hypothetical protein
MNSKSEITYQRLRRKIDHSLRREPKFEPTKYYCDCQRCKSKFRLVRWDEMDKRKWTAACIYSVFIQKCRLALYYGEEQQVKWLYELQEIAK